MIEVNLLPGAARSGARRGSASGSPRGLDRWVLAIAGIWVIGAALGLWLHLSTIDERQELEIAIESAVQDSIRYASVIEREEGLQARRDTILEKLALIQEIDAGRYIWAHLIDEISDALPEYTWLTRLVATSDLGDGEVDFQITGRTGNTFALTRFLRELEASPFIRGVQLTRTESVQDQGERTVHEFIVAASYEEPPIELLSTVPLYLDNN